MMLPPPPPPSRPDLRVVRSMPVQKPGRSKQDYGTPREFLDALERRFGPIEFDLAATDENTKGPAWFTPAVDSLAQDWDRLDVRLAFLNPPFGNIAPWAAKCAGSKRLRVAFLIPASVGSNWWARHVHGRAEIVSFLRPRLSFDGRNPYPKDCALVLYNANPLPGVATLFTRYECWKRSP